MQADLSDDARLLLATYEQMQAQQLVRGVNLLRVIQQAGLEYGRGRDAANELVRAGRVRIEGDLG